MTVGMVMESDIKNSIILVSDSTGERLGKEPYFQNSKEARNITEYSKW